MADYQSTAMIVMAQLAGWCWLGAKWLWFLRHAQRTGQGKQAMQTPRLSGGFNSERVNNLPLRNHSDQQGLNEIFKIMRNHMHEDFAEQVHANQQNLPQNSEHGTFAEF